MRTFDIKIVAIVTMIIDHIGLFFFPDKIFLRAIGRLSFPLFSWLIANGAYYSHNIKRYLIRIFILALISEVPFLLVKSQKDYSPWFLNVLFTLFLGLLAISIIKKTADRRIWFVITGACALVAEIFRAEYGMVGVLSIISFYLFFNNIKYLVLSQICIYIAPYFAGILWAAYYGTRVITDAGWYIGLLGLSSLLFISLYNRKEGPKVKYLFYAFYPLQYTAIFLLKRFLLK